MMMLAYESYVLCCAMQHVLLFVYIGQRSAIAESLFWRPNSNVEKAHVELRIFSFVKYITIDEASLKFLPAEF